VFRAPQPRSLLFRTALTLAVSVAIIALVAVVAATIFVIRPMALRSADDEAALIVLSAQTWVELPPQARPYFELELVENHGLVISAEARDLPRYGAVQGYLSLLEERLSQRLAVPVPLRTGDELVWADVPMGGVTLQVGFPEDRSNIQPLYVGIIIVVAGVAIVMIASLLIVQRLTRPLVRAARTAERFRGRGEFRPLPETGPSEIVTLARSFNTMAREVTELLANRTTLLSGVSHDLRTPLARMRVAVELLPDSVPPDLRARFERNLDAMDALIRTSLEFARGVSAAHVEEIDVDALCVGLSEPADVTYVPPADRSGRHVRGDPRALVRVLDNLVNNAVQHGGGAVELGWSRGEASPAPAGEAVVEGLGAGTGPWIEFRVADRGPGIPPAERDKIFQPFYRLESSRNRSTGGSGLGLAIVKQLCQSHGWWLSVAARSGGGSVFRVLVPVDDDSGPLRVGETDSRAA
jgi:two-component system osmolarity sensor histidine kinase EnvZ